LAAHAPKKLTEEMAADFLDMIYAKTATGGVATRRKAFIRKCAEGVEPRQTAEKRPR